MKSPTPVLWQAATVSLRQLTGVRVGDIDSMDALSLISVGCSTEGQIEVGSHFQASHHQDFFVNAFLPSSGVLRYLKSTMPTVHVDQGSDVYIMRFQKWVTFVLLYRIE